MSFDVFTSSFVWPTLSEYVNATWLYYLAMFLIIAVAAVFVMSANYFYYFDRDKAKLTRNIVISLANSAILVTALGGLIYLFSPERVITNVDEVKASIQQEYDIELTDESIENLYDTRGNKYKEHQYVADINGNLHAYVVVGGEFYFMDTSPIAK